jgi:hypothetical protein
MCQRRQEYFSFADASTCPLCHPPIKITKEPKKSETRGALSGRRSDSLEKAGLFEPRRLQPIASQSTSSDVVPNARATL